MVSGGEIKKVITSEMLIMKISNPKNSELKKKKVQELNNFILLKPIELEPFHRHHKNRQFYHQHQIKRNKQPSDINMSKLMDSIPQ